MKSNSAVILPQILIHRGFTSRMLYELVIEIFKKTHSILILIRKMQSGYNIAISAAPQRLWLVQICDYIGVLVHVRATYILTRVELSFRQLFVCFWKYIFWDEDCCILIKFTFLFVPGNPIENK